jgi:hypothetical protein
MGQKGSKDKRQDSKAARGMNIFEILLNFNIVPNFDPDTVKRLQEQTNCK